MRNKTKKITFDEFFKILAEMEDSRYDVDVTNAFKKNVKLCYKRDLDLQLLADVIILLARKGVLPRKNKPHLLKTLKCMECHIAPDWLLLWKQNDTELILLLTNTGTHSDLLKM